VKQEDRSCKIIIERSGRFDHAIIRLTPGLLYVIVLLGQICSLFTPGRTYDQKFWPSLLGALRMPRI